MKSTNRKGPTSSAACSLQTLLFISPFDGLTSNDQARPIRTAARAAARTQMLSERLSKATMEGDEQTAEECRLLLISATEINSEEVTGPPPDSDTTRALLERIGGVP